MFNPETPNVAENVNPFTPFTKYADFKGRSRRKEYWLFMLIYFIFAAIPLVKFIWVLAAIIPAIAVTVRRLHDTGRSGWLILLGLIPLVGGIILLIFCCQDSQPGINRFGYNPKGIGNEQ